MFNFKKLFQTLHRREEGITGLETAIILIAFVIVASVFAFVVLSTGLFSAERGKETVFAGLEKARGNLEVRGAVTVTDVAPADGVIDGTTPDTVIFNVGLAAGGFPVLLDPAATTNTLALNFIDAQARTPLTGTDWTATEVMGDGDNLLENGELFTITVNVPTGTTLDTNEIFTVEVIPPSGGALLINRTMPPAIDVVMDLH
ncbi:MAG TPA: archaellin/type IV pilin N-terminal domain-containing protein [Dehalococcoidia bacterium]|nr:archaellin/type IV pilin N-terminal domain-containing protein [Dehalococcoidia bacterium]